MFIVGPSGSDTQRLARGRILGVFLGRVGGAGSQGKNGVLSPQQTRWGARWELGITDGSRPAPDRIGGNRGGQG